MLTIFCWLIVGQSPNALDLPGYAWAVGLLIDLWIFYLALNARPRSIDRE